MPNLEMGGSAIYRIRVRGVLDERWAGRFREMNLARVGDDSVLIGPIADQAALSGVLNALYDLQVPVVSVDCLGLQSSGPPAEAGS